MTVTDLILATRTLLLSNPPQTGCPNQRFVDNKDMERLQAALNTISLNERLQMAMEDETGKPMAYKPVPRPPVNPVRLTCGPDDVT